MPYSKTRKLEKQLNKTAEKFLKKFEEESEKVWNKSVNNTFEELYLEAINMYDSLIEQYYKYETKSYYRHHVGIGTGTGENLYYGKDIIWNSGFIPELTIDFSGKDMDKYRHNSPDEVLDMVIHGVRGVPSKGWWTTWKGSYDGKYFSVSGVDIATAFNSFRDNFGYLSRYIFNEKINEEKKSGKYMFYR